MDLDALKEYQFDLPPELIAQVPVQPRNQARLMVIDRQTGTITHRVFRELADLLSPKDFLVLNNSKVMKARFKGFRTEQFLQDHALGGRVEFLLERKVEGLIFEGLIKFRKKIEKGFSFVVLNPNGEPLHAQVVQGYEGHPYVLVEFNRDPIDSHLGEMPIPPYIQRSVTSLDEQEYQTVYAQKLGSCAAPTAGLHFEKECFQRLAQKNISTFFLTHHVGQGTFRPISVSDLSLHKMHSESFEIPGELATGIAEAKKTGHCVAVGTTTVRALESAWDAATASFRSGVQRTELFIKPPYTFQAVNKMVTNFHLPGSSLFVMVSAFAGVPLMRHAYQEAIREQYRFYSYGDAMLIL